MLVGVIELVVNFIAETISAIGYPGIVVLMAIESACIPLPSEIIMPFSGFLVASGRMNLHAVAFAGAFGNLLGSILAYSIGLFGGRALVVKYGSYVLFSEHELKAAEGFFERWGWPTVFFSRMLPIVRTYISLPAGLAKMKFFPFCALSFLGSLPWCYLLAYIGFILGGNWREIRRYSELLDLLVIFGIVAFCIYILFKLKRRKRI